MRDADAGRAIMHSVPVRIYGCSFVPKTAGPDHQREAPLCDVISGAPGTEMPIVRSYSVLAFRGSCVGGWRNSSRHVWYVEVGLMSEKLGLATIR
jgi:hypothetical protein